MKDRLPGNALWSSWDLFLPAIVAKQATWFSVPCPMVLEVSRTGPLELWLPSGSNQAMLESHGVQRRLTQDHMQAGLLTCLLGYLPQPLEYNFSKTTTTTDKRLWWVTIKK